MPVPLLTTKLLVPAVRADLVPRLRLVHRLDAGLSTSRLTLVSAPAGYGKTTLVSGWLAGAGRPVAWVALDEGDNDPARFADYLLAALQRVDPAVGQAASAMLHVPQPPPPESWLTTLINDIAAAPAPLVLVLDDCHLIQAPPVYGQLAFLLEHQPPQLHLVMIGREDPPLPLARLRARGQVTDIRQDDLKFTEEETVGFLRKAMKLELSTSDIATLQQRTEGWIAGLQLAALALEQNEDVRKFVDEFAGSQRYVLDYLVEEVFQRQGTEVQDFLRKTSILDRLSAPLCDAVADRSDSCEILLALDRANLFIVRLDESRCWYRYHRLFRDLLRIQRAETDLPALHRRAARWFEQNGALDEAMDHLVAAEDWDGAERLMERAAAAAINHGHFTTLSRWLAALPEGRVRSSPDLAALKGWALLPLGQFEAATIWADLAASLLTPDAATATQALVLCLQAYVAQAQADIPRVLELAQRTLALLGSEDPHGLRGAALSNLASAHMILNDIPSATRTLRELARVGQGRAHPISAVGALTGLAELENAQGRAGEGIALCQEALDLCVNPGGQPSPLAGYPHLALGMICYDLNDLAAAKEHLLQGLELSRLLGPSSSTWRAAFTLARVQALAGETEAAKAAATAARRQVAELNLPLATGLVAAYEADFHLLLGNVAEAARWAESAGLSPADTPVFARETEYGAYARVLLAQNRLGDASTLLASWHGCAQENGLRRTLITVCLLEAQLQQALCERAKALAGLEEAIRLAAPEGYRRAFLDAGTGVLALLPAARHAASGFVDSLLSDLPSWHGRSKPAVRQQGLIEPLSERELEVLRLVADGLSNAEIAARLFVSVGTVKTHVHNILGKLGVEGRPRAIARARELKLI